MSAYEDWKKGKKVDTTSDYEKWKNKDKPKQNPIVSAVSNVGKTISNLGSSISNYWENANKKFEQTPSYSPVIPGTSMQMADTPEELAENRLQLKQAGTNIKNAAIDVKNDPMGALKGVNKGMEVGLHGMFMAANKAIETPSEVAYQYLPDDAKKFFDNINYAINGNYAKGSETALSNMENIRNEFMNNPKSSEIAKKFEQIGEPIAPIMASLASGYAFTGAEFMLSPYVFGSNVFGSYAKEAEKMGADPARQLIYAGIMAPVELATEKIPLGNLRKIYGSKDVLVNYLKGMKNEAIQEGVSEIAAGLSKMAVMQDTSQFMTGGRVDWDKVKNFGKQVLNASAMGAKTFALTGLPGTVLNVNNIEQFKKSLKEQNPGITPEEINEMVRRVTADNAAAVEAKRQAPIDIKNLKPIEHGDIYTASGQRAADVVTNNAPVDSKLADLINVVNNNQSYKVDDVAEMAQISPESVDKVQTPLEEVKTVSGDNEDVLKDIDIENIKPVENEVNEPSESENITSKMKQIQEDLINEEIENIKSEIGKGVELIPNPQKPDSKIRQSRNPKWYREFYAVHKRKPNNSELREMAIERLKNGYDNEEAGSIPANEDYIEAERMMNQVNRKKVAATGSKHADSGTYAKRQKTDIPEIASETKETRKVKSLEMPEIIELVKKINEGKVPKLVARFRNPGVRGQFNAGTGNIKLRQDLFKDTEQAQKTLSHEIGHLVDWLPDKEMGRGNILGRIASLKKYMKHTLGEKPGMSNEGLTAKDRRRLKAAAAELVNQEKIKDANGNEIKPAEVLAIWNDVEGAGRNKDLYNYIAKLDSKQKAQVLRDALKGMVNFNLNKNISDYKDWAKREQVIFQELVRKELKKRQIFDYETINNELKKLTQIWKPFDEAANSQYTKYRHSSPELYADAISVLFNEPTLLQKEAPEFYRGFMNYLESKPAVKRIYDEIQARLNDTNSKIDNRIKTAYEMLEKGHEKRNELNQRRNKSVKSVVDTLMTGLVDKDTGTLRIISKGKKNQNTKELADRAQYEIEESKYLASEAENYIYELGDKVLKDLKKNGLTVDDVGLYMMLKRVISERSEIANPLGYTKETAQETLDGLKKQLGEEKFAKIELGIENYRNFRDELIINRIEESGMYSPETIQMMRDKKDYAKFSVQHYLDETFGSGTTSKIYKQVGTLNDIENPFVATVLQDISMLRAAKINESKGAVIHLLREMNNTGLEQNIITPAEKVFSPALGKMIAKEPGDPSRGMIQVMYNGKVESFYVPKDIAQTFETNPFEATKIAEIWSKLNRPLKSVLVSKNPFWMVRNIMRDFRATVKNIPEIKIRDTFKLLKFYNQASKEVKEAVFKGKRSEDIQKMMKEFMLNPDRAYSAKNQNYENDIERLADEFELDVYEDKRYHGIQKGYKWFIDKLEKWGKVSEVTSKVAGYKYLVSETSRTPQEIAHIVRTRIGTPDARRVGKWHQVTNNIFMFSNINKEGWRSTIESFKENPASYAWKTIALNVAPKLMLLAAGSGLLRGVLQGAGADDPEKLERIINNIPDYDKKKYNIVPLGLTKLGKSIYLRIPEDYEGQLWGEIMFNLCQGKILGNSGALNTVNESQPYQKNPFLEVGGDLLAYYIMGTNPVDEFSGRPILPEMTYKAGGYEANKRMIGYAWKNLGGSIIYNPSLNVTNDDEEFIEKAMKTPPLNVLGTYLKISDQGKYDEFYDEQEEKGKVQAQNSLKLRNIVVNSVRKLDHIPTIQDARVLYADLKKQGIVNTSYGRFKMQYRNYASYAIGDREMKMVIKARSRKEREKLMSKFLTQLSSEEYETLKNNLRKLGVKW